MNFENIHFEVESEGVAILYDGITQSVILRNNSTPFIALLNYDKIQKIINTYCKFYGLEKNNITVTMFGAMLERCAKHKFFLKKHHK